MQINGSKLFFDKDRNFALSPQALPKKAENFNSSNLAWNDQQSKQLIEQLKVPRK